MAENAREPDTAVDPTRHVEAAAMWKRYLELGDSSSWADARAMCAEDCKM